MQIEMTGQLKAKPYQRIKVRTDHRNGSYYRNLVTKFGVIRMLEIPRPGKVVLRLKSFNVTKDALNKLMTSSEKSLSPALVPVKPV